MEVFRIAEHNIDWLKTQFEKLNKRARKIGKSEIVLNVLGFHEDVETEDHGIVRFLNVAVEGSYPCFDGWTFLASIEHLKSGNIINKIADSDINIVDYKDVPANCDHCGHKRYRKYTYIVKHENGDLKQVGSTCIKDFLPGIDPKQVVKYLNLVIDWRDLINEAIGGFHGEKVEPRFPLINVVAVANAAINKWGWTSKTKAQETGNIPTASDVDSYFFDVKGTVRKELTVTKEDFDLAETAIEWVKSQEDTSEYISNLKILIEEENVKGRHFGYVCSIIPSYMRTLHAEKEDNDVESQHFGAIKERVVVKAQILNIATYESHYGLKRIVSMKTDDKNLCVWFGTSFKDSIEVGEWYMVTGTVKDHGEYNGKKQTVLTRVKFNQI